MSQLETLISALGGIGVFLLGMVIMTDGLKALAGARLSQWLADTTSSPWSGAATGAVSTAILQSSSATTVAAVGFVGAGLLTFSQSLGIIFGANLGTTITGWMVALLGFKLKLGSLLLPVIFAGVMMRFFASARLAQAGLALAGFGLVFLGIDLLQQAAAGHADIVNLEPLAADTWLMRFKLLALGILITLITQSSSAGVATALVAINAGAINFPQGAALVIGMDVGTTVTAAIATVGASSSARRTGLSHVTYNLMTALGALLLISPFTWCWPLLTQSPILSNPEIALVAFHTTFNLIGVFLILPFTPRFAQLMETLVPETLPRYHRVLDKALLAEPGAALLATRQIIMVTDGEPTAHLEGGISYFDYPPSRRTVSETLKEVRNCTRAGITINTFMLERTSYLSAFIDCVTKVNRGRAFYTDPDYAPVRAIRWEAADSELIIVDGV